MPENRWLVWAIWVGGVVAVVWNGLGTFLWAGTSFAPEAFLRDSPAVQRDYVLSLPLWTTVTWGLGVVGGLVGSVLLLMRRNTALRALAISLFGAISNQLVYVTNPPPPGFFNVGLTVFIIGFAAALYGFARYANLRGALDRGGRS